MLGLYPAGVDRRVPSEVGAMLAGTQPDDHDAILISQILRHRACETWDRHAFEKGRG